MIEILACVGLTFILKYGSILNWPRNILCKLKFFDELFKCSLCLGFWSGVTVSYISYNFKFNLTMNILLLPFISSGVCWFADSIVTILQYIELKLEKDHNS
jgi:hypothetical protein